MMTRAAVTKCHRLCSNHRHWFSHRPGGGKSKMSVRFGFSWDLPHVSSHGLPLWVSICLISCSAKDNSPKGLGRIHPVITKDPWFSNTAISNCQCEGHTVQPITSTHITLGCWSPLWSNGLRAEGHPGGRSIEVQTVNSQDVLILFLLSQKQALDFLCVLVESELADASDEISNALLKWWEAEVRWKDGAS